MPVAQAPSITKEAVKAPAAHAATLNTRQLATSLDFGFRLDGHAADLPLISKVRSEYPFELAYAEGIVSGQLGDSIAWHRRAEALFLGSAYGTHAYKSPRRNLAAWWVGRILAPVLAGVAAYWIGQNVLDFLWVAVVAAIGYRVIVHRPQDKYMPVVTPVEMGLLHDDVVNAVFANVLTRGRRRLDPGEHDALMRGWLHIQFISYTTAAMATPPVTMPAHLRQAA